MYRVILNMDGLVCGVNMKIPLKPKLAFAAFVAVLLVSCTEEIGDRADADGTVQADAGDPAEARAEASVDGAEGDAAEDGERMPDAADAQTDDGAGESAFTFTVIGDTHAGIEDFPNFHEWATRNHTSAIEEMIRIAPDFYLHLGDMVQDPTNFAWNEFFDIEAPLLDTTPIYPTIGNHERYHENHSYYDRFSRLPHLEGLLNETRPWYSFDRGNVHFISLRIDYDSWNTEGEACLPDSPQYRWLETNLAGTEKAWKIVFYHVPFCSSGSTETARGMREYLHPLFVSYDVDLVFSGHVHLYERLEIDGITYIISGGGSNVEGADLEPCDESQYLESRNHIVQVTVDENTITAAAISSHGVGRDWETEGGVVLDQFSLVRDR
jgi:predicted phosphodiesterase